MALNKIIKNWACFGVKLQRKVQSETIFSIRRKYISVRVWFKKLASQVHAAVGRETSGKRHWPRLWLTLPERKQEQNGFATNEFHFNHASPLCDRVWPIKLDCLKRHLNIRMQKKHWLVSGSRKWDLSVDLGTHTIRGVLYHFVSHPVGMPKKGNFKSVLWSTYYER